MGSRDPKANIYIFLVFLGSPLKKLKYFQNERQLFTFFFKQGKCLFLWLNVFLNDLSVNRSPLIAVGL